MNNSSRGSNSAYRIAKLTIILAIAFSAIVFSPLSTVAQSTQVPITSTNVSRISRIAEVERGSLSQPVWSPNGRIIAVPGGLGIWLFNLDNLQSEPRLLRDFHDIVAFHPDGTFAASLDELGNIVFWDVQSGRELQTFYDRTQRLIGISDLAFSPDGERIAMAFQGGTSVRPAGGITVWNVDTGEEIVTIRRDIDDPNTLEFSPRGDLLAVGGYGGLALYQTSTWQRLDTPYFSEVRDLNFDSDGTKIVFQFSRSGVIGILDIANLSEMSEFSLSNDDHLFTSASFSSIDSNLMATASLYDGAELWDLEARESIAHLSNAFGVSYSPDGTILAVVDDSQLQLFDMETFTSMAIGGFNRRIGTMRFSSDSHWLAYVRSGDIVIRNSENFVLPVTLTLQYNWESQAERFGQDQFQVSSYYWEGLGYSISSLGFTTTTPPRDVEVLIAQELARRIGKSIDAPNIVLSPAGTRIALLQLHSIEIWNVADWSQVSTISEYPDRYQQAVFSQAGDLLITRTDWGDIAFWNPTDGEKLASIEGSGATDLLLSPDGTMLAIATMAGTVEVWGIEN